MAQPYVTAFVPFPVRLMSTTRTPTNMTNDFAREILNMYAVEDGAGVKRNGSTSVGNSIPDGDISQLMYYINQSGVVQVLAVNTTGYIYLQDGSTWTQQYSGLDTTGLVRWTHFAGKLIICNGIDPVLVWDGTTVTEIFEYIEDTASGLTYSSSTEFQIDSDAELYAVGSKVQARLGSGNFVESTVASVSGSGTITVTLNDAVLTASLDEIYFEAKPPTFAYVYAAHDRLWGFGSGPLKAEGLSGNVERTRVYYTFGVNDETAWHNTSGATQSINLADKMSSQDELVGMAVKDGLTVFFGRNYTQIWSGSNPTASGDFSWVKTMPLGAIHGNLIVEMPNDVAFFTRFGARTLSRTLQTEQLDISDFGTEVDPSIASDVTTLLASDAAYAGARSFQYAKQGWFGFKPSNRALIFQLNGSSQGWTVFDGLFGAATAFLNTPDGKLYIASGAQLYQYDENVWADDGAVITTRWWTPWMSLGQNFKRWANKQIELITDQGAALALTLKRYKNYNSSSFTSVSTTATTAADYWGESDWDAAQWDNGAPDPATVRDPFVADVFSYAVESQSTEGPLTIFGLKIQGIQER